ncbi:MAG: four helix bundle protein [Endomicrobia bacterium]|nr:four helix bundle protein [Endomicrobiia bacterium]MDW8056003.1 four helix bundle protein [Elusimicrobiota bacterium]
MKTYEDLEVFRRSHQFVLQVFKITNDIAKCKQLKFSLGDQLVRSVISIPANIAEGYGRYSKREKIRFLYISRGSVEETKYYLLLLKDIKLISEQKYKELSIEIEQIAKMLNNLISYFKSS